MRSVIDTDRTENVGCPCCASARTFEFVRREGVPVHQNLVYRDAAAARGTARGDLSMRCCRDCGFVFNGMFDPSLLDYGPDYDNSQQFSPRFADHVESLAVRLGSARGVRGGRVVEVGCGKGGFLRRLVETPDAGITAIGFDPAYVGDLRPFDGLEYRAKFYGPDSDAKADAVVSRHVIEHIPEPAAFLATIRQTLSAGGRLFLETPCVDWILAGRVVWDFFYEHCSIFTTRSLAAACRRAGFHVDHSGHVFDGQYLWIEATASEVREPAAPEPAGTVRLAERAGEWERRNRVEWAAFLRDRAAAGSVFAWGAGAKGSTFCNLVDPDARLLAGVVDINPAKQGAFIAGTAHPIVSPDTVAAASGRATVLVLNPNYRAEIAADLRRRGADAVRVESMDTEALAA